MDAAVSPLGLILQLPAGGVSAAATVDGNVIPGVVPGADLFAALLARQLEPAEIGGLPEWFPTPATGTEQPATSEFAGLIVDTDQSLDEVNLPADMAGSAPVMLLPQAPLVVQAAVPVEVRNGGYAFDAGESPAVPLIAGQGAVSAEKVVTLQRQPVAATPAAFAVPEAMLRQRDGGKEFVASVVLPEMEASPVSPALSVPLSMPMLAAVQMQAPPAQAGSAVQAGEPIPQAVGHSAWGESLGERVVWMVSQQHQGVELHLNPPSLGPLEVRLSMSDGQANLSFSTQHLPVKEAIESATPRLREMLGESGIGLGSVSVSVGSFAQHQPGRHEQSGAGRDNWPGHLSGLEFSADTVAVTRVQGARGMVDVFA